MINSAPHERTPAHARERWAPLRPPRSLRLLGLLVVALAPLTMAPKTPICPDCPAWIGALNSEEVVNYFATIEEGVTYEASLWPSAGSADLKVTGDVTEVSCQTEGKNTVCTFTAKASGDASLTVKATEDDTRFMLIYDKAE